QGRLRVAAAGLCSAANHGASHAAISPPALLVLRQNRTHGRTADRGPARLHLRGLRRRLRRYPGRPAGMARPPDRPPGGAAVRRLTGDAADQSAVWRTERALA